MIFWKKIWKIFLTQKKFLSLYKKLSKCVLWKNKYRDFGEPLNGYWSNFKMEAGYLYLIEFITLYLQVGTCRVYWSSWLTELTKCLGSVGCNGLWGKWDCVWPEMVEALRNQIVTVKCNSHYKSVFLVHWNVVNIVLMFINHRFIRNRLLYDKTFYYNKFQ